MLWVPIRLPGLGNSNKYLQYRFLWKIKQNYLFILIISYAAYMYMMRMKGPWIVLFISP